VKTLDISEVSVFAGTCKDCTVGVIPRVGESVGVIISCAHPDRSIKTNKLGRILCCFNLARFIALTILVYKHRHLPPNGVRPAPHAA
jgi:hypothetical protein